jgi:hypothetical protein
MGGVTDAGVLVTMARLSGEENERGLASEKAISLIAKPRGRYRVPRDGSPERSKEWVDENLADKVSMDHTAGTWLNAGR